MAEESFQEKTEQATPKRREESRRKGQVARSAELSSLAILVSGLLAMLSLGSYVYEHLTAFMISMFTDGFSVELNALNLSTYLLTWATSYVRIVLPFVALLVAAALAINYAQVGVIFTVTPLEPKANRISPLSGLKRIFSSRGLVELAKGLFKVAVVTIITYWTIAGEMNNLIALVDSGVPQILASSGSVLMKLGFRICIVLLFLAILDYAFQRWDYEKNLRMTRHEVKEELKQQEGDPQIRARVRSLQRELAQKRMMDDVGQADVVVTNPTHVAVALRYAPEESAAPLVVAKGQRLIAEKIKELARLAGVPLVENKPLARALFKAVRIGDEIPEDLFKAVAEVLAFVFQLRRNA